MDKVIVNFPGDKKVVVPYKSKVSDIISQVENENDLENILAFRINNEVKNYDGEFYSDSTVDYIKYGTEDGYKVYLRSLKFILYIAIKEINSQYKLSIPYSIYGSYYCKLENEEITEELIKEIKKRMIKIVQDKLPFERRTISAEEATELYKASGDIEKVRMMEDRIRNYSTIYFCKDYYNYFYGAMVPNSGYIKGFDVVKYDGGFLLRMPKSEDINSVSEFKPSDKIFNTFEEYEELDEEIGIKSISDLNDSVKNGKIGDVIRLTEAMQDKKLVKVSDEITNKPDVKIVLIAGPSSSGKTTTAQKIAIHLRLNGKKPLVISMDNYFVDREDTPKNEEGKYDFECLEAIDLKLFNEQMLSLISGKEVELPKFNFMIGKKEYLGDKVKLEENGIIIIEGIHGLNEKMTEFIPRENKYKIFISALTTLDMDRYTRVSTLDTRLIRRIVRDSQSRGHGAESTLTMWTNVRKGEEKYIFPYQEEADYIFNTSMVYEMGVLKNFAQPILMQVDDTKVEYSESRRLYEFLNNFLSIETNEIPIDSTIREFIGDGCFYR